MLCMMRKSTLSNHLVADKRVDKYADQVNKLYAVLENVIMVSLSKISAEDKGLKLSHLINAENDHLLTLSLKTIHLSIKIFVFFVDMFYTRKMIRNDKIEK